MSKIKGIERLEGRGIKAKVTDVGKLYSSYTDFAKKTGYSDAADEDVFGREKSAKSKLLLGKTVDVLARGRHPIDIDVLYVIQDETGERFIFSGKGIELIYPENIAADSRDYNMLQGFNSEGRPIVYLGFDGDEELTQEQMDEMYERFMSENKGGK